MKIVLRTGASLPFLFLAHVDQKAHVLLTATVGIFGCAAYKFLLLKFDKNFDIGIFFTFILLFVFLHINLIDGWLRMGLLPPPREFCRHILSYRELKAESFKRCLHSVLRGVSL